MILQRFSRIGTVYVVSMHGGLGSESCAACPNGDMHIYPSSTKSNTCLLGSSNCIRSNLEVLGDIYKNILSTPWTNINDIYRRGMEFEDKDSLE
jgi:hypothetical protein